jgi:hypothetical protein
VNSASKVITDEQVIATGNATVALYNDRIRERRTIMKQFLILSAVFVMTLGALHTQYAQAATLRPAYAVSWYYDGHCVWPVQAAHWRAYFDGGGCSGNGNPTYNGSTIGSGHWWANNIWQLQRSWMQGAGCLGWDACWATSQSCTVSSFKAWCNYY